LLKSPKTALLVLALLLLSSSWNVQANGKKVRAGNRSDAIILPSIFPELPSAVINYVRPNLLYYNGGRYAGPAYNPKKGFLVLSTNPSSYGPNFPTTGGDGLYFDLLITGIDVRDLTWEPVTHEGITATVTNVIANDYWIPSEDRGKVVARVKLTGPRVGKHGWWKLDRVLKPRLPQTFELVGRHIGTGDEVVKYGFVLKQWFVSLKSYKYSSHTAGWCNQIGYQMPRIKDLTNSVRTDLYPPVVGATPSSRGNYYMRHIDAGFFSEWGRMGYDNTAFRALPYWAMRTSPLIGYAVSANYGEISRPDVNTSERFICVSNLKP
jgi:hypothetical protein